MNVGVLKGLSAAGGDLANPVEVFPSVQVVPATPSSGLRLIMANTDEDHGTMECGGEGSTLKVLEASKLFAIQKSAGLSVSIEKSLQDKLVTLVQVVDDKNELKEKVKVIQ